MKIKEFFPWIPIGEIELRQTGYCWASETIVAVGEPGKGVRAKEPSGLLATARSSDINHALEWARQAALYGRRAEFFLYYPAANNNDTVLVAANLQGCPVNGKYVAHFLKNYPGCTFYLPAKEIISPGPPVVGVKHKGNPIGLISPLRIAETTGDPWIILADSPVAPPLEPAA